MLISVIIPVYNVEKTLERAVASVQKQGVELEIILVNDGSTDSSGEICEELKKSDARIQVIHQANAGLSAARNRGIEAAKGKFLAFLDSDDYFEENILEHFSDILLENPHVDLFLFNVARVKNEKITVQESFQSNSTDASWNMSLLFDYPGINFYAWNKIYRKQLFDGVRFPEGKLYEDTMPSYWTMKQAVQVISTMKTGIYYIQNPDSIVASAFRPNQYDNVSERIQLLSEIEKDYPELTEKALGRLLDGFLSTGYKLASSATSEETKRYTNILKEDSRSFLPRFKKAASLSKAKISALYLFLWSPPLYRIFYKWYLGK